jgi:hypothetical protein
MNRQLMKGKSAQHAINAIWRSLRAESAVQFMKFIANLKPRSGQNRQMGTYSCTLAIIIKKTT